MTRSLKLIEELTLKPWAKEISNALYEIRQAVEAESAREQNINARLQAQVANLNWRLKQAEQSTR